MADRTVLFVLLVALGMALTARTVGGTSIPWDPDNDQAHATFAEYLGGQRTATDTVRELQTRFGDASRSRTSRAYALRSLAWIDALELNISLGPYFAELRAMRDWRGWVAAEAGWFVRVYDPRVVHEQRIRKLESIVAAEIEKEDFLRSWAAGELCANGLPLSDEARELTASLYGRRNSVSEWCESVVASLRKRDWEGRESWLSSISVGDRSWSRAYSRALFTAVLAETRAARDRAVVEDILRITTGGDEPGDLVLLRDLLPQLRAAGWTNETLTKMAPARPQLVEKLTVLPMSRK